MTLIHIVLATLVSGLLSVFLAAWLSFGLLSKIVNRLVSLSVGMLLASAILNLLPEAVESGANVHGLAWTFLGGLIAFISLEKLSVFRHSHHHEGDGHDHAHGHDHDQAGQGGMVILVGDSIHNFSDGLMIAAAFLADIRLGWMTAFAVAAHEIPQEIGDFMVLLNAGYSKSRALLFNALSGLSSVVGGVIGYYFLSGATAWLPYALMITMRSFVYIALADLIPSMQQARNWRDSGERFFLLIVGVGLIALLSSAHHAH